MKKNTFLYLLIGLLLVMNGFFMFTIFNDPRPPRGNPGNFIAQELQFTEAQMEQFVAINEKHHEEMKAISEEIKKLKDALFTHLSDTIVQAEKIDMLTRKIGEKERQKDVKTFYHFKEVQQICTNEQRTRFNTLVTKALHAHGRRKPR